MAEKRVGLTFGVFDLLHIGHINLLQRAKDQCDTLIVCVSTDTYSQTHKGKNPIIPFWQRIKLISALRCVDVVDMQDDMFTKKDAIERFKPDVLFVGDDWTKETYTGEGLGVPVVYLPHTKGVSSTLIRNKLHNG